MEGFGEDDSEQPGIIRSAYFDDSEREGETMAGAAEKSEEKKKAEFSGEVPEIFQREEELKRFSLTLEERIGFLDSLLAKDLLSQEEFVDAKKRLLEEVEEKKLKAGSGEEKEEEEEEKFFMSNKMESMRFNPPPTKAGPTSSTFFETGDQSHLKTLERKKKEEEIREEEEKRKKIAQEEKISNRLYGMVSSVFQQSKSTEESKEEEEKEQAKELGFKALEAPGQAVFAAASPRKRGKPAPRKDTDDMEAMKLLERSLSEVDLNEAVQNEGAQTTTQEEESDDQERRGSLSSDIFDSKPKLSKHPSLLLLNAEDAARNKPKVAPKTRPKERTERPRVATERSTVPQTQSPMLSQTRSQEQTQLPRESVEEELPTAKPASVFAKLQSLLGPTTTATTAGGTTTGGTNSGGSEAQLGSQSGEEIPVAPRAAGGLAATTTYASEVRTGEANYDTDDENYHVTPGFVDYKRAKRERERRRREEEARQVEEARQQTQQALQQAQQTRAQTTTGNTAQSTGANASVRGIERENSLQMQLAQLQEFRDAGALSEEDYNAAQARLYADKYLSEGSRNRVLAQSSRELASHIPEKKKKEPRGFGRFFKRKKKEEENEEQEQPVRGWQQFQPPNRQGGQRGGSSGQRGGSSGQRGGRQRSRDNYPPALVDQLQKLKDFKNQGVLTQEDYEEARTATLLRFNY